MRRVFWAVTLTLALGGVVFSVDFGVVLNTAGEYMADTDGRGFTLGERIAPWFSAAPGGKTNFYFSGKVTLEYGVREAWTWPPVVELERTELNFRPVQRLYFSLGRQSFRDTGGMIVSGLFDGVSGTWGIGSARFSLGGFYTGLLYKKTAEILMTAGDLERYYQPLDYGDMTSYFSSRRVVASVGGEFPDLTSRLSLAASVLAQFDLNRYEGDSALHSQYVETRLSLEATDSLRFTVSGIGGLTETDGGTAAAFAAALQTDLAGKPRKQGAAIDIGAYEKE
jgi:hypothetical protein